MMEGTVWQTSLSSRVVSFQLICVRQLTNFTFYSNFHLVTSSVKTYFGFYTSTMMIRGIKDIDDKCYFYRFNPLGPQLTHLWPNCTSIAPGFVYWLFNLLVVFEMINSIGALTNHRPKTNKVLSRDWPSR